MIKTISLIRFFLKKSILATLLILIFIFSEQVYAVNTNQQNSLILPNGDFSNNDANWTNAGFQFFNGEYAYINANNTGILSMSNKVTCDNPSINTFAFDYGWNNGTGSADTTVALDVKIDGIRYLYITTPSDGGANTDNATNQGGDALVTAYNGATFTISNHQIKVHNI